MCVIAYVPTPAVCVNCHKHKDCDYLWLLHSAPPFLSLHTFLQLQYTIYGIPILHSTMQNTEILQPSFWAMRLKKCEGSHKQSVEEFTNKHKHPGSQSNTSATAQVPCPQLNGSCGSTVAPPYLLCRHWCPGRRLTCSSLIWLDPYRSSNCLRLQLVTQTLHEELRNDRVWFPSRPACCGKLRRSIWTQKRTNVFQTFRLKVWFFANAPEGSPSCLSLKRTPPKGANVQAPATLFRDL